MNSTISAAAESAKITIEQYEMSVEFRNYLIKHKQHTECVYIIHIFIYTNIAHWQMCALNVFHN